MCKSHLICWLCLTGWRKFWGALDLRVLTSGPLLTGPVLTSGPLLVKTRGLLRLSGLLATLRKLLEEELLVGWLEKVLVLLEKVLILLEKFLLVDPLKLDPVSCLFESLRPLRGGTRFTPGGRTI